ncbi:hypothetical protein GP5015_1796 [gamma proteobacterium HTCC5015]|nr:hypothetical protein GP5015_1796 [gamma proteobacterium HTCC5015]
MAFEIELEPVAVQPERTQANKMEADCILIMFFPIGCYGFAEH